MKIFLKYLIFVFLTFPLFGGNWLFTQDKDWSTGNKYNKLFDPKTIVTISGEVDAVNRYYNDKGLSYGLNIDVKTSDDETITVLVGPGWYVEDKGFEFNVRDVIAVTGSRVKFNSKDAIIATEILKDSKSLKLRDSNGNPLWIGWGTR